MRRRRAATAIAARGAVAPSRPAMLTLVGLDQRGRASGQGAKSSYPQRPQSEHARKPPARCLRARDPRRCREELPPPCQEPGPCRRVPPVQQRRSEEHTSELQSLMRISYAVFCLKKKTNKQSQPIYT